MEKITKVYIHVALSHDFQKTVQKYVTKASNMFPSAELVILV